MERFRRVWSSPLIANQLQFGPQTIPDAGRASSMPIVLNPLAPPDGSVLDYCRLHHITIQPWSLISQVDLNQDFYGASKGVFSLQKLCMPLRQTIASFEALVLA